MSRVTVAGHSRSPTTFNRVGLAKGIVACSAVGMAGSAP
jgi:hypothetical protein